ncbi:ribosomal RNA large subunit methyltransferase H [Striga asiatica]|uniref:Ribosomal RNA large subunit methyltransferase H n=1 Tax=Striga asiatica TaxID=4170 RepID=A0A5A7R2S6_STRAF|nr:ribosomal RNA large subunit methyltransferase H [Striga asiatica]
MTEFPLTQISPTWLLEREAPVKGSTILSSIFLIIAPHEPELAPQKYLTNSSVGELRADCRLKLLIQRRPAAEHYPHRRQLQHNPNFEFGHHQHGGSRPQSQQQHRQTEHMEHRQYAKHHVTTPHAAARILAVRQLCRALSITPLGRPVVPEEKSSAAISEDRTSTSETDSPSDFVRSENSTTATSAPNSRARRFAFSRYGTWVTISFGLDRLAWDDNSAAVNLGLAAAAVAPAKEAARKETAKSGELWRRSMTTWPLRTPRRRKAAAARRAARRTSAWVRVEPVAASMRAGRVAWRGRFSKRYSWVGRWVGMWMVGSLDRKMVSLSVWDSIFFSVRTIYIIWTIG